MSGDRSRGEPAADGRFGWVVAALVVLGHVALVALAVLAARPHV